jgi:hypothetical protein
VTDSSDITKHVTFSPYSFAADALTIEGDGKKKCGCFPSWFKMELKQVFDLAWSMVRQVCTVIKGIDGSLVFGKS